MQLFVSALSSGLVKVICVSKWPQESKIILLEFVPWWRHQMETFSTLLALCVGNSPVSGEFPAQRPVTRSFDVFFHLCLNKRLSKQSWCWWFETPSRSLWHHCNVKQSVSIAVEKLTKYETYHLSNGIDVIRSFVLLIFVNPSIFRTQQWYIEVMKRLIQLRCVPKVKCIESSTLRVHRQIETR